MLVLGRQAAAKAGIKGVSFKEDVFDSLCLCDVYWKKLFSVQMGRIPGIYTSSQSTFNLALQSFLLQQVILFKPAAWL